MKNIHLSYLSTTLIFLLSVSFLFAQDSHQVEWLKSTNFEIENELITHKQEFNSAYLLSAHYLDFKEDGWIEISNLEDLTDFSIYLESEDELGNLSKDFGLLFNHVLENIGEVSNEDIDELIETYYSKFKLEKTISKDGSKVLETRDYKILRNGKIIDELDIEGKPFAIPYTYTKVIRIGRKEGNIVVEQDGEVIKTFNDVKDAKYRIGIHSYIQNPEQLNRVSIKTTFLDIGDPIIINPPPVLVDCINPTLDNHKNWTSVCSKDITGRVVGSSITYFDALGKPSQSQTVDIKTRKKWMSQSIYDSQGRAMFNSLSAPKGNYFGYKQDFIKKENGSVLTKQDLEIDPYNPPKLGNGTIQSFDNTLGDYYSDNNDTSITSNKYQDTTPYPFSRTIYSELNPGSVLKTLGGNRIDLNEDGDYDDTIDGRREGWMQGFSYTTPAAQEMNYVFGKAYFEENFIYNDDFISIEDQFPQTYVSCTVEKYDMNCNLVSTVRIKFYNTFLPEIGMYYKFININNIFKITDSALGADANSATYPSNLLPISFNSCSNYNDYTEDVNLNSIITGIINNPSQKLNTNKVYKSVSIDVDGNEGVVFTDADGKTLAAAKSGGTDSYPIVSLIGKQGFMDIHVPKNYSGTIQYFGGNADYEVWDLKTEERVYNNLQTLEPGFYRIVAKEGEDRYKDKPALTYIDDFNQIQPVFPNSMGVKYNVNYYDFTVNYYDKSGKLKETVQPLGFDNTNIVNGSFNAPNHTLKSTFEYNSLGQVEETTSPDEGTARFKYRQDGQIRFSQNAKQQAVHEVSYTNYDELGRPIESGVVTGQSNGFTTYFTGDMPNNFTGTRKEVHQTLYDEPDPDFDDELPSIEPGFPVAEYQQSFVAGNVSRTTTSYPFTNTTWYSYDIYGRVEWLVQEIDGIGVKTIDYEYDPITSNVTKVIYQKHKEEEYFAHNYEYDNDTNQLVRVYTEDDDPTAGGISHAPTLHAEYTYYENGSLKRTQLPGQGIDYVYNLKGQLKSINHPSLEQANDPGGDSNDLFGMAIDYNKFDYNRANSPTPIETMEGGDDQYNGNIKAIRWKTKDLVVLGNSNSEHNVQTFTYNDNNWLETANFGKANNLSPSFTPNTGDPYKVFGLEYDRNGNITQLNRNALDNADVVNPMDRLSYHYKPNTNQLTHVDDAVTQANGLTDLKDQDSDNYAYNNIGQLVANYQDGITYEYNASGLVTRINKIDPLNEFKEIYFSDFNNKIEQYWETAATGATFFLKDFQLLGSDGNGMEDFCPQYATENLRALGYQGIGNFTIQRNIITEPNELYNISFDAILKQIISATTGVNQNVDMHISIIENSTILQETTVDSVNSCNFYHKENVSFTFTPTTNNIQLLISVTNANTGEVTKVFIDNFSIRKSTQEPAINFYYDDKGKRIRKEEHTTTTDKKVTYYVRDAAGSPMAIYSGNVSGGNQETVGLTEVPVYGLSRIGMYKNDSRSPIVGWNKYLYELTDHLGNVRATYYNQNSVPEINGATDYYPFGMPMPERKVESSLTYRYAYQGQEKDPETGKEAFELRLWDGRIGRWLSTDPYGEFHSPYLGMGNNPVMKIDPDGGSTDDPPVVGEFENFQFYSDEDGLWQYNKHKNLWISQDGGIDIIGGQETIPTTFIYAKASAHAKIMANPLVIASHAAQNEMKPFLIGVATLMSGGFVVAEYGLLALTAKTVITHGVAKLTTPDGFLFKGFTINTPMNIPVQRFGNMSYNRPDFWGLKIGTNKFVNRTFAAIKPEWNPLTQYTQGIIPKGTTIRFGVIGPQGLKYPGGSLQFITNSNDIINQSSKIILRH